MTNEILTEEELDSVTGGTAKEFTQIISAMSANRSLFLKIKETLSKSDGNINLKDMKEPVTEILRGMNINATLDLDSAKNSYKDTKTGNSLSHVEVIKRIKSYS